LHQSAASSTLHRGPPSAPSAAASAGADPVAEPAGAGTCFEVPVPAGQGSGRALTDFAAQTASDLGSDTTEDLVIGVDQIPAALDFMRFGGKGFHFNLSF
jgi:hypothetical protein